MSYQNMMDIRKGLKFENPGFLNVISFLFNIRKHQPVTVENLCKEIDMPLERVRTYVDFLVAHGLIMPVSGYWAKYNARAYALSIRGEDLKASFQNRPKTIF